MAVENLSGVNNQSASFAFIERQREVGERQATAAKPQKKSEKETLVNMNMKTFNVFWKIWHFKSELETIFKKLWKQKNS